MTITDISPARGDLTSGAPSPHPSPWVSYARTAWRGPEWIAYQGARAVMRFPKSAAAVVSASVASPYVSLMEATIAGGFGALALTASAESRVRLSSLTRMSRARNRAARIRRRYRAAMEAAGLAKVTGSGQSRTVRVPRLRRLTPTLVGAELTIDAGRLGLTLGAFKSKGDILSSYFRAHHIEYRSPSPGTVTMSLTLIEPFKGVIRARDLPAPSGELSIVVGLDSRGNTVERDMSMPVPIVIVGAQGAGKSSELWTILYGLQRAGIPFRVRSFDPKGGVELRNLQGRAYQYEDRPTKFGEFLECATRALLARMANMKATGRRSHTPTEDEPLDVLVIDELLTAIAMSNGKEKIYFGDEKVPVMDAFMLYLSQARAAGFLVVALSQLGQKQVIGPLMDLFGHRTVLRVGSDDLVRAVGYDPKICPAMDIKAGKRYAGIGFTMDEFGEPVKYRAGYLNDKEREAVAVAMGEVTKRQLARAEWKQRQDKEAA